MSARALYAAVAVTLEDVRRRTVLPLLRRGAGSESLTGSLGDQVAGPEREADVRQQL